MAESNNDIRRPRNLQGLLRFAMEATKTEDAPAEERNFEQMDPERRQFLENALKSLTIDVIEQLQSAAQVIGSETATEDEKISALDIILSYVDDIDTATDFCKIGGLFLLLPCIDSEYSTIRRRTALLIGELAQNNPYCQNALLEADVLPNLLSLLRENDTSIAGLKAISCMVRSHEPCFRAFTKIGGIECLVGCLQQSDEEKLITQTAFLLNSLCSDFPEIKSELLELKAIEVIIPSIKPQSEYNVCLETLLSVLCSFTDSAGVMDVCRSREFGLKATLEDIIKRVDDKPECKETVEYSKTLLKLINDTNPENENTDR